MNVDLLPFDSAVPDYAAQAERLLAGHRAGDARALQVIHENHPRFLDAEVKWLPLRMEDSEIASAEFELDDARLALARAYCFRDWAALVDFAESVADPTSAVHRFESAVEAVISGDLVWLRTLLEKDPSLVRARSMRLTKFDPADHQAMLLHYVASNGVEGYRQKSPANAVEVARMLLEGGAEVDALARLYGGECSTMSLLVSSSPPAEAGIQVPLVEVLVDFGASVEGVGTGRWVSPLITALVFGFRAAAHALVRRGARVDTLVKAAGVGLVPEVESMAAQADDSERQAALALAVCNGLADVVQVLVEAGADVNRFHPEGFHAHGTPLHHAAAGGNLELVRFLVEAGARVDARDKLWDSTPLGWAEHCGRPDVANFLRGPTLGKCD